MTFLTDTTGVVQDRELAAGSSYLSSEDPRAHFGLGAADRVAQIVVEWPDGTVTTVNDADSDQVLRVERP